MLMSCEERAFVNLDATPRFLIIPSPTTLTIEQSLITSISSIMRSRISSSNSFATASRTVSTSLSRTQKEIVYSEEDWVIKRMEEPAEDTALKTRLAIPVRPRIAVPPTLTIETCFKEEIPQILNFFRLSKGPFPILVPRAEGLWLFKDQASIPFACKGARVFG